MITYDSPEGMVWFDTTSEQLKIFIKGKWEPMHSSTPLKREHSDLWGKAQKLFRLLASHNRTASHRRNEYD